MGVGVLHLHQNATKWPLLDLTQILTQEYSWLRDLIEFLGFAY